MSDPLKIEPGSVYRVKPGARIDHAVVFGRPVVFLPPGFVLPPDENGIRFAVGEPLEAHALGHACSYCEATVRPSWDKCRNCGAPRRASP